METVILCIAFLIAGIFVSPFVKLNYAFGYLIGYCAGSIKTVDALRKRNKIMKENETIKPA